LSTLHGAALRRLSNVKEWVVVQFEFVRRFFCALRLTTCISESFSTGPRCFEGFTDQYNAMRLVYWKSFDDVHKAIRREK
jgi:hypothetical protein